MPLVGRDRELGFLDDTLARAAAGRGAVVVLSGEPGIGKTATARAFAAGAGQRGATVLWGTCYEGDWQPAFGPWADALSPLGVALAESSSLSAQEARLRAFRSLVGHLATAAAAAPVVVVLDDLQWASEDSISMLGHVAPLVETHRLMVLATHRDPDPALVAGPLAELLGDLARLGSSSGLALIGLGPGQVAQYLGNLFPGELPDRVVATVHGFTAGNPFFVGEMVRHLVEDGMLVHRGGAWSAGREGEYGAVPPGVRQVVRARVARLGGGTRALLGAASLFTGAFAGDVVAEIAGLSDEELLDALDEALATGLLRRSGNALDPYAFAHGLVRHAVAEEANPDRRSRFHRRAALALARRRPTEYGAIAEQFHASRALSGGEQGVVACLRAAEAASGQAGHRRAIRLLEMARDLLPARAGLLRADVVGQLAVARADALEVREAIAAAREAIDALQFEGAAGERVAELVWRVATSLAQGAPPAEWQPLVAMALAGLGEPHGPSWARLVLLVDATEPVVDAPITAGRALGLDPEAVAILRSTGSEVDESITIEPFGRRTPADTAALRVRVAAWCDPMARLRGLDLVGRDLNLRHGRPLEAIEWYMELAELSGRVGSVGAEAEAQSMLAMCQALAGDLVQAEQHLQRAGDLVASLWPTHRLHLLGTSAVGSVVGYFLGDADWEPMAERLDRFVSGPSSRLAPFANAMIALGALSWAMAGRPDPARRLLDALATVLAHSDPTDHAVPGALWFATAAAWELADCASAAALHPIALRHVARGGPPGPTGSLNHALVRLDALIGHDARPALAAARVDLEPSGCRAVQAVLDFDMLRIGTGGRSGAVGSPTATDVARRFEGLGMRGWAARARILPAARPAGLTAREVEILSLLAGGSTNAEMAVALVLSPATVQRHIANIYAKAGVRNRAEATSFARRHGIE